MPRRIILAVSVLLVWSASVLIMSLRSINAVAMRQDETSQSQDFGELPEGVEIASIASSVVSELPAEPTSLVLERLVVEPTGPTRQMVALGYEILYVELGQVTIIDELGIEGAYPAGASLLLTPGVAFQVRASGAEDSTLLRLSLRVEATEPTPTPASSVNNDDAETMTSAELIVLPVGPDLDLPVTMFIAKATWQPGTDLVDNEFSGPAGILAAEGTLMVSGPSGIEGPLKVERPIMFSSGVRNRLRNTSDTEAVTLIVGLVSLEQRLFGLREVGPQDSGTTPSDLEVVDWTTNPQPGPGITGDPVERWHFSIPGWWAYPLAISGNTLLVGNYTTEGSDEAVYAVNAATGDELWRREGVGAGDARMSAGLVYLCSREGGDDEFLALDTENGEVRWRLALHIEDCRLLALSDGIAYVDGLSEGGTKLTAVDVETGLERWQRQFPSSDAIWLVSEGETIHVSASGNPTMAYAISAETGEDIWQIKTENGDVSSIFSAEGLLFTSTYDETTSLLLALDARSGDARWQTPCDCNAYFWMVKDGIAIVGKEFETRELLLALDVKSGDEVWRAKAWDLWGVTSREGVVFLSKQDEFGDPTILALDAETGVQRWSRTLRADNVGAPTIVGQEVYIGGIIGDEGLLFALDARTGNDRWRLSLGEGELADYPLLVNGKAYVGSFEAEEGAGTANIIAVGEAE